MADKDVALFSNMDMYLELHKLVKAYSIIYGNAVRFVGADKVVGGKVSVTDEEFIAVIQDNYLELGYTSKPTKEEIIKALQNSTKLTGEADWSNSLKLLASNPKIITTSYQKFKEQDTANVKTSQENIKSAEKVVKDNKKENAKQKRRRGWARLGKVATVAVTTALAGGYLFGAFSLAGGLAGLASISTMPFATLAIFGGVLVYKVGKSIVNKIWSKLNKAIDKANAVIKNDESVLGSNLSLKKAKELLKQNTKAFNMVNSKHHAYSAQNVVAFNELEGMLSSDPSMASSRMIDLGAGAPTVTPPAKAPEKKLKAGAPTVTPPANASDEKTKAGDKKGSEDEKGKGGTGERIINPASAEESKESKAGGAPEAKEEAGAGGGEPTADEIGDKVIDPKSKDGEPTASPSSATLEIHAMQKNLLDKDDLKQALTEIIYDTIGEPEPKEIVENLVLKGIVNKTMDEQLYDKIEDLMAEEHDDDFSQVRFKAQSEKKALATRVLDTAKQRLDSISRGEKLDVSSPSSTVDKLVESLVEDSIKQYTESKSVGPAVGKSGLPIGPSVLTEEQQKIDEAVVRVAHGVVELFSGDSAPTEEDVQAILESCPPKKDGSKVTLKDVLVTYKGYMQTSVEWKPVYEDQIDVEKAFVTISDSAGDIYEDDNFGLDDLEQDAYQEVLKEVAQRYANGNDAIVGEEAKKQVAEQIVAYFTTADGVGKAPKLPDGVNANIIKALLEQVIKDKPAKDTKEDSHKDTDGDSDSEDKKAGKRSRKKGEDSPDSKKKGVFAKMKSIFGKKVEGISEEELDAILKEYDLTAEDLTLLLENLDLTAEDLTLLLENPDLFERIKEKASRDGVSLGDALKNTRALIAEVTAEPERI